MSPQAEQVKKQFRTLAIITWAMLVVSPIVYLIAGYILSGRAAPEAGNELAFYMLFMVALIDPPLAMVIERFQINQYRSASNSEMTPFNLFQTIGIIKMAFIETVYIFGLVSLLLTGEFTYMLWFYPIGVVWTMIYWPRRHKYEDLIRRLELP